MAEGAERGESPELSRFSRSQMHAAATLYYLRDATQADVAHSLGVSRATVSRLLSEARRLGIVRIEVVDQSEAPPESLEHDLADALGLDAAYVAPQTHTAMGRSALAAQAGRALEASGLAPDDVLLVSSGRTVWDVGQEALPHFPGTTVTPTVGGQHEPEAWYQTNEITRMFAQKIGGRPEFLYAPAQPGPELYSLLLEDAATRQVLELWERARCALVGVGAPPTTRASMPHFVPRDADWLRSSAGDICTRFFDEDGRQLDYPGSAQLVATPYETLRAIPHTVAVATGTQKVPSLLAGARAGWFNELVTDTATATALMAALSPSD